MNAEQAAPVANDVPDSAIKVYANKWVATIIVNPEPVDGFFDIYCTTVGTAQSDALEAAEYVLKAYAFGRAAFIRVRPEAHSYQDFDTKITRHIGITRFSYRLEAGDWHYPDQSIPKLFGEF